MEQRQTNEKYTAYHEAGLVVAYIHYGHAFDSVNLYDDSEISGGVKEKDKNLRNAFPKDFATIFLAGGAAESKLRSQGLYETGMSSDLLNAIDLVGHDESHNCMANAEGIVNENWSIVRFIAQALLEKKTLTYNEVLTIVDVMES